jgi:hypothetical protein
MNYEELNETTRQYMLVELENELASNQPYISKALSDIGKIQFPNLLRTAIQTGTPDTLFDVINRIDFWDPVEKYITKTGPKERQRNIEQSATRLSISEFSTFYVKGLSKKLLDEGETLCEIYRGALPKWEPGECADHEGMIVELQIIHNNHRRKYWPEPGEKELFAIPFGPGCHHLIKRITKNI